VEDYKAVTGDLKRIYQSVTEEEALLELDNSCARWDDKYPQISRFLLMVQRGKWFILR
jgi:putative transposase